MALRAKASPIRGVALAAGRRQAGNGWGVGRPAAKTLLAAKTRAGGGGAGRDGGDAAGLDPSDDREASGGSREAGGGFCLGGQRRKGEGRQREERAWEM